MRWSPAKRNATPAQFRRLLPTRVKDSVKLAERAGRKMAKHLLDSNAIHSKGNLWWSVRHLSKSQILHFAKAHGVPRNHINVMLAVAWSRVEKPRPKMTREPKETAAPKFWRGKKTSLGHRGGAVYRSYLAKTRKSLNLCLSRTHAHVANPTPTIRRSKVVITQSGCIQPMWKAVRRLPRVTLIKFGSCGKEVPFGGTVFCEEHSPRRRS